MKKINGRKFRHELKFNIGLEEYHILRQRLAAVLKTDPHAGPDGRYNIRSLYLDDHRNSALFEKTAGVHTRKKYRIRIYDHSDKIIKLERKLKVDQYVSKDNIRLNREEADRIIEGDVDFLLERKEPLLKTVFFESRLNILRPNVIVEYDREAYIHPAGNVRITFDIGLRTCMKGVDLFDPDIFTISAYDPTKIILEVKYDSFLPGYIRDLFPESIMPRSAIGKFVISKKYTKLNDWED